MWEEATQRVSCMSPWSLLPEGGPCRCLLGDQLAHQVPSGFNCASSWIFILPPLLSHIASPSGHIRGHEERHTALASSGSPVEQRQTSGSLGFIFPGKAAVSGQGLAKPTFSKSLWKDEGAALHSPCPGISCLLHVQAGITRGSGSCWRGHVYSK